MQRYGYKTNSNRQFTSSTTAYKLAFFSYSRKVNYLERFHIILGPSQCVRLLKDEYLCAFPYIFCWIYKTKIDPTVFDL